MANSLSAERTSRPRKRSPAPLPAPQIEITPVSEKQSPNLQLDTLTVPRRRASHGEQTIDAEFVQVQDTSEFRAAFAELKEYFQHQFGSETTPKQVFQTLLSLKSIPPTEAYLCLALIYPSLFRAAFAIQTNCAKIWQILGNPRPGYFEHIASQPFLALNEPNIWWTWEVLGFPQRDMPYLQRCQKLKEARTLLESLLPLLSQLQLEATQVEEKTKLLDWHQSRSSLSKYFVANKLVVLESWDRQATLEHQATLSQSFNEEPTAGIDRKDSASTALELPLHNAHLRDRSRNRSPQPSSEKRQPSRKKRKVRYTPKRLHSLIKLPPPKLSLDLLGRRQTAKWLVTVMSLIAAAAIGLAVWQCPPGPPSTWIAIDSNFWSTTSATIVNIVTFYALVIPLLRHESLKAKNKWLFNVCLILNPVTSFAAMGVYPASPRGSLIIGYISNIASILATLELIQEAATTIQEKTETIRHKNVEIDDLTFEVDDLERKVDMLQHSAARTA